MTTRLSDTDIRRIKVFMQKQEIVIASINPRRLIWKPFTGQFLVKIDKRKNDLIFDTIGEAIEQFNEFEYLSTLRGTKR